MNESACYSFDVFLYAYSHIFYFDSVLHTSNTAISLEEVFGIGGYHTWPFPIDPVFEDYDKTMGFSTPQRLAREQQFMEKKHPICKIAKGPGDVELPTCVSDFLPA